MALWNELISWTAIPTFPPCGSTIPLFKNGDSEPAENGLPMVSFFTAKSIIIEMTLALLLNNYRQKIRFNSLYNV